jgi:hypothetical protein
LYLFITFPLVDTVFRLAVKYILSTADVLSYGPLEVPFKLVVIYQLPLA